MHLREADPEGPSSLKKNLPRESLYGGAAVIDPDFRGSGLQRQLLEKRKDLARELKKETIIGSVDPENGPSLRNITESGGRVLVYSPDFLSTAVKIPQLIWEIDTTLPHEAQKHIEGEEPLTPNGAMEALKKMEKKIVLLVQNSKEPDLEARNVMAKILADEYVGTGVEKIEGSDVSIAHSAIIFRHISSFSPEVQKRLRERKKILKLSIDGEI